MPIINNKRGKIETPESKELKDQKTLLKSFATLGKDAVVMQMKYAKMQSAQEKLNLLKQTIL